MSETPKLVVFLNSHGYAGGAANATRARGLVEAVRLAGYEVRELSHETWLTPSLERWFAGATSRPARIIRVLALGSIVRDWLDRLETEPCAILVLGTDIRFLRRARRWATRHNVPIIDDVIDWYEVSEGRTLAEKALIALTNYWSMPFEAGKCDEVIVVSSELGAYFDRRGIPQTRVPALLPYPDRPVVADRCAARANSNLSLAYVGNPGLRDAATINNLVRVSRSDAEVLIQLVGAMPELQHDAEPLPATLKQLGMLDRGSAVAVVEQADFTVLQRPAGRRFARAGFPSKVAESLLSGTPVMVNLTSDLAEYVVDRRNGVLLADDSFEALLDGIERARAWMDSDAPPDRAAIAAAAARVFTPASAVRRIQSMLSRLDAGSNAVRA